MRAALVVTHEAMLFKTATLNVGAKLACQKTMLLITKRDLSADVQPRLYEMGRCVSMS